MTISILLVDDHPSVMEGTKLMLEKEGDIRVTMADTGDEALVLAQQEVFDIMLFDLNMPELNGFDLTRRMLLEQPNSTILIFTGFDISPYFSQLIDLGIAGFVPKTASRERLVNSIRSAHRREAVIPLDMLKQLRNGALDTRLEPGMVKAITAREIEILKEVAKGKSNKDIASQMLMSQRSLEYILTQVFQKLGVKSRVEAVTKSKQAGWIMDGDFC